MKRNRTAVFVHGAGGGGWEWLIWQRVFHARNWKVLAPDLMPLPTGIAATQFADYAAQVRSWCADVEDPMVLVGASLGGLLALHASVAVNADALVLINPLPPADIGVSWRAGTYPDVVPWAGERSLSGTRRALADADDAACLYAFRRWRDESGTVLSAAAAGISVEIPGCPVLVLASERDTDVSPPISRRLAERLGAAFLILEGASHVGPLLGRCANSTAETVAGWCSGVMRAEMTRQENVNGFSDRNSH